MHDDLSIEVHFPDLSTPEAHDAIDRLLEEFRRLDVAFPLPATVVSSAS